LKVHLAITVGPDALALAAASTVHEVEDRGAPRTTPPGPPQTFRITERAGRLATGGKVTFIEMNWADLSRIGAAQIVQSLAALRLLYQAPNVLCRAFLHRTPYRFHQIVRRSILLAIDTVRWVIAGMNGTIIACALLVGIGNLIAEPLSSTQVGPLLRLDNGRLAGTSLAWFVMLAAGTYVAYRFARRSEVESNGLADVAYSTAVFSGIGCVVMTVLAASGQTPFIMPTEYLAIAMRVLIVPWVFWSAFILLAAAMLLLLAVKRMMFAIPPDAPSLARISGALGLAAQQGAFLKIAVSLVGFLIVQFRYDADCGLGTINEKLCLPFVHQWLPQDLVRLQGVFTINSLIVAIAVVVTGALLSTALVMSRVLRFSRARVYYGGLLVEAFAEIAAIARQMGMTGAVRFERLPMPPLLHWVDYQELAKNATLHLVLMIALIAIMVLLVNGRVQSFFSGLVHFVNDVVDHHFRPIEKLLPIVAAVEKQLPKSITGPGLDMPRSELAKYPRRERIKQRLDSLMIELFEDQKFDRLVFIAHSQGTVIVHDYLKAIAGSGKLDGVAEIHVLTLASPLTHLYQHYFEDYRQASIGPSWLPAKLISWSNVWRIDDPIADTIRLPGPPAITDGILGLGGHIDYWRDPAVLTTVYRLLTQPLGSVAMVPDEIRFAPPRAASPVSAAAPAGGITVKPV
jgi:hypothetical protein